MQRLIDDANEWGAANGKASNLSIDSFSDVVTAIDQIQQKQNIAGTTAKEAATTIEGSIGMTKAAWQNLLTEFGKDDADIGARASELVTSAVTAMIGAFDKDGKRLSKGILGRAQQIVGGISKALPKVMPQVSEALGEALPQVLGVVTDVLPLAVNVVTQLAKGVATKLPSVASTILPPLARSVTDVLRKGLSAGFKWVTSSGPELVDNALKSVRDALGGALANVQAFFGQEPGGDGSSGAERLVAALFGDEGSIAAKLGAMVSGIGASFVQHGPEILAQLQALGSTVMAGISQWGPSLLAWLGGVSQSALSWLAGVAQSVVQYLVENGPQIVSSLAEVGMQALAWLSEHGLELVGKVGEVLANVVNYLVEHREEILAAIGAALQGVVNAVVTYGPTILQNVASAVGKVAGYLVGAAGKLLGGLLQSLKDHWPEIKQWFMDLPSTILAALGDLGGVLLDAGHNLISGFFEGMTGKFKEVQDWIGGIGQWIAEHKGPKAYDLGLLVQNGKWVMGGFGDGLMRGLPALKSILATVTDTIRGEVDGATRDLYSLPGTSAAQAGARRATAQTRASEGGGIAEAIAALREDIQNMKVCLDGDKLVGGIATRMDRALVM